MTNEQKKLLLKDICCRLPYGVKASTKVGGNIKISFIGEDTIIGEDGDSYDISFITPYLFPLSRMTKEQIKEFNGITQRCNTYTGKSILLTDFCNKNHIDYRGLIPMGLAIDATNLNIY